MNKSSHIAATVFWITLFSIAMAYLESAVVVYLRVIYYPDGFGFPLVAMDAGLVTAELWREVATMVMLLTVSIIGGKNLRQRFAYFIFCFGVWDIFYYVFLYVLLGWPESLLTWDILFLIPVTWVGPVLAPVLVSLTMILIASLILFRETIHRPVILNLKVWSLFIAGAIIIFISFVLDYSQFILSQYSFRELWNLSGNAIFDTSLQYVPVKFNWFIFICGQVVVLAGVIPMLSIKKGRSH